MSDDTKKQEARDEILRLVREYCKRYHARAPYTRGDRISYAGRVYDSEEVEGLVDSALEFWLTSGRYTDDFEAGIARFVGVKHCAFVNSGSSANLCAFMALTSPLLGDRRIMRGDEVITLAAGFPTTISPIVQYGAVPVFVDASLPTYNVDADRLEDALSDRTKCVFIAHTLGDPFNIKAVKEFCDRHALWLIEDNCDALGSEYTLDGTKGRTGSFGDISTLSFYPAHHMTTGEGGAVCTDDDLLNKIVRSMRDWGRDCVCPSGRDDMCGHRFDGQFGELPRGYDHKYVYSHFGYNLKATDMQAAIGCAQLKKLPSFVAHRRENFAALRSGLDDLSDKLILPEAERGSDPSWFGFPMTVREGVDRGRVVRGLEDRGVQTRMLFAGDLIKHPCFDEMRTTGRGYRVAHDLKITDRIMEHTFWIGVYPGMTSEMIGYMIDAMHEAVRGA